MKIGRFGNKGYLLVAFVMALLFGMGWSRQQANAMIEETEETVIYYENSYSYALDENNQAYIKGYYPTSKEVVITSTLGGYPIIGIMGGALRNREIMEQVEIPGCITEIDMEAFDSCINLKKIIFSEGLITIGANAFQNIAVETIELPCSLKKLDSGAFSECFNLQKIIMPNSIISMGASMFDKCNNLKVVCMPLGTKEIPFEFFSECVLLEEIQNVSKVTNVQNQAFVSCKNIKNMSMFPLVQRIGNYAFQYSGLEQVELSKQVEYIGEYCFDGCYNLREITIVNPSMQIEQYAIPVDTTIRAYPNSSAHKYALDNGNKFEALPYIEKIQLNKTALSLSTNGSNTYQLQASVLPSNSFNKKVIWSSSNTKVVSVEQTGKVRAVGAGKAVVTVQATDGSGFKASCTVAVVTNVTSVKLNKTKVILNLDKQKTYTLKAIVAPSIATNKTITWKSSYPSIATVNSKGVVTAKAAGRTWITATSNGKVAKCEITVTPKSNTKLVSSAQTTKAIRLSWNRVSGITGYCIYRYNPTTKKDVLIHRSRATTGSYTVRKEWGDKGSALTAGKTYIYRIQTYKVSNGKTYYGRKISIKTATNPSSPSLYKITRYKKGSKRGAKIYWKRVAGVSQYQIYMSTKSSSGYKLVSTVSNKKSSSLITGLKKGKKYYFKVRAVKRVDQKKYYSGFSKKKYVRIK